VLIDRHRHAEGMKLAAAFGIVYVVWGSTYLAIAVASRTLPPLLMLSARFLVAGALLWAWCAWRGHLRAERPSRRQWGAAALVGGLLLFLDTGAVALAEQRVATGTAALLVASVPLFMAVLERSVFGIRITLGGAAGIGTGLLGVALLVGPSGSVDGLGALALLGASLVWAVGSLVARVVPLPRNALVSASMQMLAAGAMLGVAGALRGEVAQVDVGSISVVSIAAFGFLVVFGSILAFTAYAWLLERVRGPLLSSYAYVNPAVAVALGWAFAGEHVGGKEIAAGLVILASVGMIVLARGPKTRPEPIAESLPQYIRAKDAQVVEFPRSAPRLAELHRISA
jgi:drug/metabolite transporter (DMT)-like permease